jgi:hypothetical protein
LESGLRRAILIATTMNMSESVTSASFRLAGARRESLRNLLALLFLFVAGACTKPGGLVIQNPQDPARDYSIDMGTLSYGDSREHTVQIKNAEGRAVAIKNVSAGCACTAVRLSYLAADGARVEAPPTWGAAPFVLPKDALLDVQLTIDSKVAPAKNAPKLVRVLIVSDSEVDPFKALEVHVFVEAPFAVVPETINLGQVALGAIAQGKSEISRWTDTGEIVTGVLSKPDNMDVALETPEQLGMQMWRLTVRWFPPFERGIQLRSVVLSTTGPGGVGQGRPLEIRVQALGVDNVIAEPMLFSIPEHIEVNGGAGAVTLRSMVAGNRLFVTGARTDGPMSESFRASASAIAPDDKGRSENWLVQLTCIRAPQLQGAFSGYVIVSIDDPSTPEVRIPYTRKAAP